MVGPSGDVVGSKLCARSGDRARREPAGESDRAVPRVPLTFDLVRRVPAPAAPVHQESVGSRIAHAPSQTGRAPVRSPRFGIIRRGTVTTTSAPTVAFSIFDREAASDVQSKAKLELWQQQTSAQIGAGNRGSLFVSGTGPKTRYSGKRVKMCRLDGQDWVGCALGLTRGTELAMNRTRGTAAANPCQ
jgi:hypothetical protein